MTKREFEAEVAAYYKEDAPLRRLLLALGDASALPDAGPEMEPKPELAPCPFCGRSARVLRRSDVSLDSREVRCDGCAASSGPKINEGDAIVTWNRRVPTERERRVERNY